MHNPDTIIAPITGSSGAAVSVVRVSGPETLTAIARLCDGKDDWGDRHSHFVRLKDGTDILDEGLITVFRAPASYTGEDVAEISVHGSPFIVQRLLECLLREGTRMAQPGEFTQRAFLNRKMDLSQAEAVADLIAAESAAAHRVALNQLRGGFKEEISRLREKLIHFASLVELELDFSEEDVEFADRPQLKSLLEEIENTCTALAGSFRQGNAIREGIPVAIAGKPNAGKSTLLNALLKEERAIVSEIAGTTRDTIEERLMLGGMVFRLMDTAGLRETTDKIERIGVERARARIDQSALVLYVFDVAETSEEVLQEDLQALRESQAALRTGEALLIPVANKADLASGNITSADSPAGMTSPPPLLLSAREGQGMAELLAALEAFGRSLIHTENATVITNLRHAEALRHTAEAVRRVLNGLQESMTGDLLAADIRAALHHLGSITGEITTDDLLENIFRRFCIGK